MVKIKKQLVSKSVVNELSYGNGNRVLHIVIHETANTGRGANAQSHADLQSNGNSRSASWHYQVDDKHAIQSFQDSVRCWHAGGDYNNHSIGIEICVNSDGDFKKAVKNAAELVKHLKNKHKKTFKKIVTHYVASGWKDCPHYLRSGAKGITWNDFLGLVNGSKGNVSTSTSKPSKKPAKTGNLGLVDYMNSKGMNSTQSNRKKLARQYGISGYDFSADKNIELLEAIKDGKPKTNSKAKVKKGAKVTLSNSASKYATGENIPNSVKGKTYTVQQVKKNQVLLKEIYSWVNSYDIAGNKTSTGSPKKKTKLPGGTLRRGDRGNGVKRIQRALNKANFKVGKVDGIFGADTEDGVRRFQKVHDPYKVDGIYGKRTRKRLRKII